MIKEKIKKYTLPLNHSSKHFYITIVIFTIGFNFYLISMYKVLNITNNFVIHQLKVIYHIDSKIILPTLSAFFHYKIHKIFSF